MRSLVVLVVASLTLTGCLGGDDADDPTTGDGAATGVPVDTTRPFTGAFDLAGCRAVIAVLPVPASAVQPHLPDGFRSLAVTELFDASAPQPPGREGNLGLEVFDCEGVMGLDGSMAPGVYASFWTAVEAPEDLRHDVTFHFVKWDVVVADEALRAELAARGVPAVDGSGSFAQYQSTPVGIVAQASTTIGDEGPITFFGSGTAPYEPTGDFVEYTAVPAGLAMWHAEYVWDEVFAATVNVEVPSGGFAAGIAGPGPHQGIGFVGIISFPESSLTVPV